MLSSAPWAILPDRLLELSAAAPRLTAMAAPRSASNFTLHQGAAIIPLSGILAKSMQPFMALFGGTSTISAHRQFSMALNEGAVDRIVLLIDSPGGTVDGVQTFADAILAARGKKPIIALADGCMCSAAYWIGAAADRIYASSGTTQVGSIGVVAGHRDFSGAEAKAGIKTTEITAGKYKRIASNYSPLSADGRASIQDTVDYLYSLFVSHVAKARNVSENTVLSRMADGRVFIGQQAVAAGLVDGIRTLDQIIKGDSPMTQQKQPKAAGTRQYLYEQAQAYQAAHPGTDAMTAMRKVAEKATIPGCTIDEDRAALHAKVKAYQDKHPGMDYMKALRVVMEGQV